MNKKILALVVLFVVILIVFLIILQNRNSNNNTGITPTPGNSGNVKLIWWNLFEPQANVQPLIDAFNKENPTIEIQYVQVGKEGIEAYKTGLEANLNDEDIVTSPDIMPIGNTWTTKYKNLGLIKAAPSNTVSTDDLKNWYPIVSTDFVREKAVYALPLYMDSIAIIYNKDLLLNKGFNAPAQSWSDFNLQAQKLTLRDKNNKITKAGFSALLPVNSEFYFEVINTILLQQGVSMLNSDGSKSDLSSQEEASAALEAYKKYISGSTATWDATMNKDIAAFLEGNLAMYPAPSWRLMDILQYNQKYNLGLNVGVAQMPQIANSYEIYWPSYWGLTVSKDCQNSEAAWKFIQFITNSTQLQLLNKTVIDNGRSLGILYPRLDLANQENLTDIYLAPYALSLAKASDWDMYDGWALKKLFDTSFGTDIGIEKIESSINQVRRKD